MGKPVTEPPVLTRLKELRLIHLNSSLKGDPIRGKFIKDELGALCGKYRYCSQQA
jgi:hypothetical protein